MVMLVDEISEWNGGSSATDCGAAKRGRGRPLGSSRYAESDRVVLEKIADRIVYERDLPIAAALRGLGYVRDADVRRLQAKWRSAKDQLLDEAQQRHVSPLDRILQFLLSLGAMMQAFMDSDLIRALQASCDRAVRRHAAEQPNAAKPSFQPIDRAAADAVIARFESRCHVSAEDLLANILSNSSIADLPQSQKLQHLSLVLSA